MESWDLIAALPDRHGRAAVGRKRAALGAGAKPRGRFDSVFNLYFLTALLSTSGIDTLMLLTAGLLVWELAREFRGELGTVAASFLALFR